MSDKIDKLNRLLKDITRLVVLNFFLFSFILGVVNFSC